MFLGYRQAGIDTNRISSDFEVDAIGSQPCSRTGKTTCREQFLFDL